MNRTISALVIALLFASGASGVSAEDGKGKPAPMGAAPPAPVGVAELRRGAFEPVAEFVGTVYFANVAKVAAEVEGVVEAAPIEEGGRVKKGQKLAALGADQLDREIEGAKASHEQTLALLESARRSLDRIEKLYAEDSVSLTERDSLYYSAQEFEKRADAARAEFERLVVRKEKKTVSSPLSGIVVEKSVEVGEWVPSGGTVAVVADDSSLDAVLEVPSLMIGYMKVGREFNVRVGDKSVKGRFIATVPKGDVATRTFAVKLRMKNPGGLLEGMEARATLPTGGRAEGLIAPRDAVINKSGRDVVFAVIGGGTASMIPVTVTGYEGAMVSITGEGLAEGMSVVVKGNERLRDGQAVSPIGAKK